ncbi:MAG: PKD domain-containing protein, partial [Thermoguttaceae bacterium]
LPRLVLFAIMSLVLVSGVGHGQSFRRGGGDFNARRIVTIPQRKSYNVVVTDFYHHGEISADGANLVVATRGQLVPCKILQLGPGDFCRLAFQPIEGRSEYEILYGGKPPGELPPAWTSQDGLLLETRHFRKCNLRNLDSIRKVFQRSAVYGADYVDGVFQQGNPFSLNRKGFFSKYSGYFNVPKQGKYGFWTSSRDASFLLIDDKLLSAAPGRHGPMRRALPGTRKDVELSPGAHKFEYYHVAVGPRAVMSVAFEPNPTDQTPRPQLIPPEVFNAQRVAHLPARDLSLRNSKLSPDFIMLIDGEALLPDESMPLIDVLFSDLSPETLIKHGKAHWDFGDGQTSDELNPEHVYLRPGLYTVKHSFRLPGNSKTFEIANRLEIDRPSLYSKEKPHELDYYLKLLETYDPRKLDADSLRRLVLAYQSEATQMRIRAEDALSAPADPNLNPDDPKAKLRAKKDSEFFMANARVYLTRAFRSGITAFHGESTAEGDEDLMKLARLLDSIARCGLGNSAEALQIWQGAVGRVKTPESKAECQLAAADILVNDLLQVKQAKPLLEEAAARMEKTGKKEGSLHSTLARIEGDYFAAVGNGPAARKAYAKAEKLLPAQRKFIESTAVQGAHSRATEEFIRTGQLDRAAEELRAWQREFPTDKIDGYLTLMQARYWAAREKYVQAIAQTQRIQTINPDSAYVDRLLFLAADCQMRLGHKDRAVAKLHLLEKNCPGSPLLPLARKNLSVLEKNEKH